MSAHIGDGEAKPRCSAHHGDVDLGAWNGPKWALPEDFAYEALCLSRLQRNWEPDPNNDVDEDNA